MWSIGDTIVSGIYLQNLNGKLINTLVGLVVVLLLDIFYILTHYLCLYFRLKVEYLESWQVTRRDPDMSYVNLVLLPRLCISCSVPASHVLKLLLLLLSILYLSNIYLIVDFIQNFSFSFPRKCILLLVF